MSYSVQKNKIYYHMLNLDYSLNNNQFNLENQTNQLITNLIRTLYSKLSTLKDKPTIIYEYRDDVISLIGLNILKTAQNFFDFNLYLYGYKRKTRKAVKKEKFISYRKLKQETNFYYISSFNFIYKVINQKVLSKKFSLINEEQIYFQLMEKFTPDELKTAANFYFLKDNYNLNIDKFFEGTEEYNSWITYPYITVPPQVVVKTYSVNNPTIMAVWLTGDLEIDRAALDQCINTNNIVFYFFKENKPEWWDLNIYNQAIQNKDNCPNTFNKNINPTRRFVEAIRGKGTIKMIGKWPIEEYEKFTNWRLENDNGKI